MDLEARRLGVQPTPTVAPELVPEDVRSEIDHQQRVAEQRVVGTLTEDGPEVAESDAAETSA